MARGVATLRGLMGQSVTGLEIRELTPTRLDDYLHFFDEVAFKDFPWWSSCYCRWLNDPSDPQGDSRPEMRDHHRGLAIDLVKEGRLQGLLAYRDGGPVGWVNAAPRASYRMPRRIAKVIEDESEPVGSVTCFIVGAGQRRHGVASVLLEAACERFRRLGLQVAEGYPNTAPPPTEPYEIPWTAHNHWGPVAMFEQAGFQLYRTVDDPPFAVYRRPL